MVVYFGQIIFKLKNIYIDNDLRLYFQHGFDAQLQEMSLVSKFRYHSAKNISFYRAARFSMILRVILIFLGKVEQRSSDYKKKRIPLGN